MKKILFTIIMIFSFIPIVFASDISYDIKNYYINADIEENGDLKVTELIVLKGTFNGYIRDIVYKNSNLNSNTYENNTIYNASGIQIESISAKLVDDVTFDTMNDTDFTELTSNQASNLGYVESSITNGRSYKMYFRADYEKVAFKITYTLTDVIVRHNDLSELYWTFIGDDYSDVIRDLQIKVNLPGIDTSDNFRVWAHGDLTGEIEKYDNSYLMAKVSYLSSYSSVDIRATFDNSLINENLISKKESDDALDGILKVEVKRANKANRKRQLSQFKYDLLIYSSYIWRVAIVVLFVYIYFKYDREYKKTFFNKYNREFIDDYNVEVVDYLMHKKITTNAFSASIMNLIYKKNIKVEEIPNEKNKKVYEFTLLNKDNTTDAEKYLIFILFEKVGKDNKFTSKELKDFAGSSANCNYFSTLYTNWKNKVISDGTNQGFYESTGFAKLAGVIMLLIAIFIIFLSYLFDIVLGITFSNLIWAIIFLIYTFKFWKRSKKGNEHYYKWKAFKNFLNDFGRFDLKELPEVVLWERYMVYATLFGLANKVSKVMNVKIKELQTSGIDVYYTPTFTDWYIFNSIDHMVKNTFSSNASAISAQRIASSSSSDGFGGGGGFSSGGGFGGGGGGGHGF